MSLDDHLKSLRAAESQAPELSGFRKLRDIWQRLPVPRSLRGALTSLYYRSSQRARNLVQAEQVIESTHWLAPNRSRPVPPGPFVLSGYLNDIKGIGRGGRMSLQAFRAAGYSPVPHDLRQAPEGWGTPPTGGVWFCHCNAPEAVHFLQHSDCPRDMYRIGYWAWELPRLPESWGEVIGLFHEVWAPSTFVAEAIRAEAMKLGVPVRVVLHPFPFAGKVIPDRSRFGLPEGVFTFLCMYDVHSSATRKNPAGAITAFQQAFGPDRADVLLLVKVVAAAESTTCLNELQESVRGWPNIRLLTDMLSDEDADCLIASADAFVSLHRSEGFGLSIAQALALGRPVIATGWSGNMDFCQKGVALVPYRLVPVVDPTGVYKEADQVWAEPDLHAAARAMADFVERPKAARALGLRGRGHVRKRLPRRYKFPHLRRYLA